MPEPFIGEIRMFAGSFAPLGWALCNGQLLSIAENDVLFNLIGTTYGGDGQETFALPDLRGRLPLHQGNLSGNQFTPGESGGVETVTLTVNQIPVHTHPLVASTATGSQPNPGGRLLATNPGNVMLYIEDPPSINMAPAAIAPVGGSQPHDNFQPYLCINFIISLFGIYPTQS